VQYRRMMHNCCWTLLLGQEAAGSQRQASLTAIQCLRSRWHSAPPSGEGFKRCTVQLQAAPAEQMCCRRHIAATLQADNQLAQDGWMENTTQLPPSLGHLHSCGYASCGMRGPLPVPNEHLGSTFRRRLPALRWVGSAGCRQHLRRRAPYGGTRVCTPPVRVPENLSGNTRVLLCNTAAVH
jgi:hypothetical protein